MAIKTYKPTTPSRRNMSVTDYSSLSKVAPERSLLQPLNKKSGRNSYGRITVRHRGGGNRKKYRVIDFKRNKFDVPAEVKTIEYDPNRSAHIALIQYEDGVKSYITAPEGLKVGDTVVAGTSVDIVAGNALPLQNIPVGTMVHNVELYPGNGAQLARSAGNGAQLMALEGPYALLRLPSGELRNVPCNCCWASFMGPRVVTDSTWVWPLVNIPEPWALASRSISAFRGRMSSMPRPSTRLCSSFSQARTTCFCTRYRISSILPSSPSKRSSNFSCTAS